jgi:hypothetical protein
MCDACGFMFEEDIPVPTPALSISSPPENGDGANITFYTGQSEMLKVASDGFYVRGKKLDIDDNEAEHVYRAMRQFLIWAALTKE